MDKLQIKFKKLSENTKSPQKNKGNCFDLFAHEIGYISQYDDKTCKISNNKKIYDSINDYVQIDTNICVEIPEGYVGLLFPRSSISETRYMLANSVGVVDSTYRGPIIFRFREVNDTADEYKVGDRIGQILIIPHPEVEFVELNELSETERGSGGFGSTGK